jgi:hypothetical protein
VNAAIHIEESFGGLGNVSNHNALGGRVLREPPIVEARGKGRETLLTGFEKDNADLSGLPKLSLNLVPKPLLDLVEVQGIDGTFFGSDLDGVFAVKLKVLEEPLPNL